VDVHRAFLASVRCPTWVVVPERSPFPPGAIDALRGALPAHTRVDVSACGHMVPLEAPEALACVLHTMWIEAAYGRGGA
jgi:pimeloyl-ACP methyl ester carboxylesterase